jgi:hypothetical protein
MLSLLGSLLGFGTSFLPKVMDYFQDKSDKKHELMVMEVQIKQQKELALQKLEMVNVEADIREIEALQKSMQPTGVKWVDGLRGSVRPVITYAFFLLFCFVEISAYYLTPELMKQKPKSYFYEKSVIAKKRLIDLSKSN